MSQELEPSVVSQAAESFSWSEAWFRAVTRPSVATFESLLQDSNATTQRAYIWVAISALIAYLVSLALTTVFGAVLGEGTIVELVGGLAICGFCGAIVVPFLSVLTLLINVGLMHLCARVLDGPGTFDQLLYAAAAYQAPLSVIGAADLL